MYISTLLLCIYVYIFYPRLLLCIYVYVLYPRLLLLHLCVYSVSRALCAWKAWLMIVCISRFTYVHTLVIRARALQFHVCMYDFCMYV